LCLEANNVGRKQSSKRTQNITYNNIAQKVIKWKGDEELSYSTLTTQFKSLEVQRSFDINSSLFCNNLAIIYQSTGKLNISMHYYVRSLLHLKRIPKRERIIYPG